jgi:hypothetical protein
VKRRLAIAAITLAAACVAACGSDPPRPTTTTASRKPPPTVCTQKRPACEGAIAQLDYDKDVLPALKRACFACHAGDGMAALDHDFSNKSVSVAQRTRMGVQVVGCAMPPRQVPVDPADTSLILAWATCGSDDAK